MEFVPFPKIGRLCHAADAYKYYGELPDVLTYEGTVKLHGTNLAVVQDTPDGPIAVQSRNRFITPTADNCGSAAFVTTRESEFLELFSSVRSRTEPQVVAKLTVSKEDRVVLKLTQPVILFGEFVGRGVQKGVGVSAFDRFMVLFDVVVGSRRVPFHEECDARDIRNVHDFKKWTLTVPRDDIEGATERADAIAEEVGADCPVARALGKPGQGEGVVWRCKDHRSSRLWFKSKCAEHSVAAPKPKRAKNPAEEFAERFVTPARLRQAVDAGHTLLGQFVTWVVDDVMTEEGSGLSPEDSVTFRKAVGARAAAGMSTALQEARRL
jgi:RNA ligase